MAPRFTEEQLAQLTDEEREGLIEEEGGEEDDDADGAGDADGEDGEDGEGGDAAAASDIDADAAGAGDGDGADDTGQPGAAGDAKQEDDPPAEAAAGEAGETGDEPTPAWVLPGDFDDRLKAVKDEKADLARKFDEGELTGEEFRQQLSAIDDRHDDLRQQKMEANIVLNAAKRDFGSAVTSFMAQHPQYEKGSALYGLLDAELRRLQSSAANPLNPALLDKAHARIAADIEKAYGIKPAAKAEPAKKDAVRQPGAKRADPPPSLRNAPAADIEDVEDGGEFAALDRLADKDSVAYERELANLRRRSPDAYDRYMAT